MDRKLANKLRFHLAKLVESPAEAREDDWQAVARSAEELAAGPADGALELAAMLPGLADAARARWLPANVALVRRELERVARSSAPATRSAPETAAERLARLLAGRAVLVFGGEVRQDHLAAFERAFATTVHWPRTSETNPVVASLEPWVARADVALVVLLIRFIRHASHDGVTELCERYGKPLARVTAGYNAERVATQALEQCGRRLGGAG